MTTYRPDAAMQWHSCGYQELMLGVSQAPRRQHIDHTCSGANTSNLEECDPIE